jgi:hypothetical protein
MAAWEQCTQNRSVLRAHVRGSRITVMEWGGQRPERHGRWRSGPSLLHRGPWAPSKARHKPNQIAAITAVVDKKPRAPGGNLDRAGQWRVAGGQ